MAITHDGVGTHGRPARRRVSQAARRSGRFRERGAETLEYLGLGAVVAAFTAAAAKVANDGSAGGVIVDVLKNHIGSFLSK